jgi:hypothetical protein
MGDSWLLFWIGVTAFATLIYIAYDWKRKGSP